MPHPLEQKIAKVRRRLRRLTLLYGISWVVGAALLAMLLFGTLDYLIHIEDRGVRAILTLVLLGVVGWTTYRHLLLALVSGLSDVQLALRIERRFPGLNDRLASAVQFLRQAENDPRAGSAELRRAVVHETERELDALDLDEVLDPRPVYRVALAAGGSILLVALIAALDPTSVQVAVARLTNPFGATVWPKQNHLQIRQPVRRLAMGQPFEVEIVDAAGAPLPDEVWIQYRRESDGKDAVIETEPAQAFGARMYARREAVHRPFAYRAIGGDDRSMPWIELEVVEPPLVESLELSLHYPDYTGWPAETSEKHLRALVGTRVALAGTSTKKLRAATIHVENGEPVPLQVSEDGYGFELPPDAEPGFVIAQSGSYWFSLEDGEGLIGGPDVRYEIRAIPDLAPNVSVEAPDGNIFVTPEAVVPLRIVAKDDLAIAEVALRYSRSDRSEEGEFNEVLYAGPAAVEPHPRPDLQVGVQEGDNRLVEHQWDLSVLEMPPDSQITFYATATDYQPLVGQSPARRLTLISPEELQDRLAERQKFILSELSRVLRMQQESRTQTRSLEIQWEQVRQLEKTDIDALQGAELTQRQVNRALTSRSEGVQGQIDALLADLENNRVDSPDLRRRMESLAAEIDGLAEDHLPIIGRELTNAMKTAQDQLLDDDAQRNDAEAPPESLTTAGKHQDEVIARLEGMLGELSQWDNYRRFHRDVAALRREQEEVTERTAEVGRETLSKDRNDLTPEQLAELKKLTQQQQELSRRFDTLQQQMQGMADSLQEQDPLAAATLTDALHQARQEGVSGQMRTAGQNIDQNQIGQATARQKKINDDLQEVLDILANRREHELERLVKKLREAEEQMTQLRKEQEGLRKKMQEAAEIEDEQERRRQLERLTRQQRELQQEAERFARRLQRLQADQAGRSTARAGSSMGQAGQQGEQGDAGGAAEGAERAQRDLEEAQQQLAERRRQAEIDLAMEQLAKIQDSLVALRDSQQGVLDETIRLEDLLEEQGRLTRGQSLSVRDLSQQQARLRDEASALSEKLSAAEVFALALTTAAREMGRAAELLDARELGTTTRRAEEYALRRLNQLIEALEPEDAEANEGGGDQDGGGDGGGGDGGGDGIGDIAQLKMIKLMQVDIHERTRDLEEAYGRQREELTDDQQHEYALLSEEQGQLADLIRNLSQPAEERPEDDLDALPDLRDDPLDDLFGPLDEESIP